MKLLLNKVLHTTIKLLHTQTNDYKYILIFQDILEFIDFSYNNFVSNTSLVIASYWDLFLQKPADGDTQ